MFSDSNSTRNPYQDNEWITFIPYNLIILINLNFKDQIKWQRKLLVL